MGLTFKENCPDTRNSKVIDLIEELNQYKIDVTVYDPWVNKKNIEEHKIKLIKTPKNNSYDCILLAVPHKIFKKMGIKKIMKLAKKKNIIFDLKYLFPKKFSNLRI